MIQSGEIPYWFAAPSKAELTIKAFFMPVIMVINDTSVLVTGFDTRRRPFLKRYSSTTPTLIIKQSHFYMRRLIQGVGINDANYVTSKTINGKLVVCPYYQRWISMIHRCYYKKLHEDYPTYSDCSVIKAWHRFSAFKEWMQFQDWRGGKHLDKDILAPNNKIYGAATCVFITSQINSLLNDCRASRGKYAQGVSSKKKGFIAQCRDKGVTRYLGYYATVNGAEKAYLNFKSGLILLAAHNYGDKRVSDALVANYAKPMITKALGL